MSKIILTGYIIVADTDLVAIKNELPIHAQLTREEVGCIFFEVLQDEINENKFNVYEEFVDRAAFELHQQRIANSTWALASKNAVRHYTIQE